MLLKGFVEERSPGNENKREPHKSDTIDDLRELNRRYDCAIIGHDKDLEYGVIQDEYLERVTYMSPLCSAFIKADFHVNRLILCADQDLKKVHRSLFFVSDVRGYGDLDKQMFLAGLIYNQLGFMYLPTEGDAEIIYTATDKRDSPFVGHRMKASAEEFYENGGWFSHDKDEERISVEMSPNQYCFGSGMRAWGSSLLSKRLVEKLKETDYMKYVALFDNPIIETA